MPNKSKKACQHSRVSYTPYQLTSKDCSPGMLRAHQQHTYEERSAWRDGDITHHVIPLDVVLPARVGHVQVIRACWELRRQGVNLLYKRLHAHRLPLAPHLSDYTNHNSTHSRHRYTAAAINYYQHMNELHIRIHTEKLKVCSQ